MRSLLALAFLALLPGLSWASTEVYETARGSATVSSVSISTTSGAVQIDLKSASRSLDGRFTIELWNDDDADDVHCAFNSDVSTITSPSLNANYGRRIPPRQSWTIAIPDAVPVYCRIAGNEAAATAILCATQLK